MFFFENSRLLNNATDTETQQSQHTAIMLSMMIYKTQTYEEEKKSHEKQNFVY